MEYLIIEMISKRALISRQAVSKIINKEKLPYTKADSTGGRPLKLFKKSDIQKIQNLKRHIPLKEFGLK